MVCSRCGGTLGCWHVGISTGIAALVLCTPLTTRLAPPTVCYPSPCRTQVIASQHNICKQLHMPAQSGSSLVLERMRRGYTREAYDELVAHVRATIPSVALSTDMIAGFCGEAEEEHAASVDLMRRVGFEQAFLFAYSMRDKTHSSRHYQVPLPPWGWLAAAGAPERICGGLELHPPWHTAVQCVRQGCPVPCAHCRSLCLAGPFPGPLPSTAGRCAAGGEGAAAAGADPGLPRPAA